MFTLLLVITVCASSHPLEAPEATTSSSKAVPFTVPSSAVSDSQASISANGENRLEITLKMDEGDKEVIDSDMGKYLRP